MVSVANFDVLVWLDTCCLLCVCAGLDLLMVVVYFGVCYLDCKLCWLWLFDL